MLKTEAAYQADMKKKKRTRKNPVSEDEPPKKDPDDETYCAEFHGYSPERKR